MLTNKQTVRIRWGDCDPAGIIFYPRYLEIFDNAVALLFERMLGITKHEMFKAYEFAGWPLVRVHLQFLKPTRFGNDVDVETGIKFSRSSFDIEHKLSLNGELCVECEERRVWVVRDADNRIKSHSIPEAVLKKFGI